MKDSAISEEIYHASPTVSDERGGERAFLSGSSFRGGMMYTHYKHSGHIIDSCYTKYPHLNPRRRDRKEREKMKEEEEEGKKRVKFAFTVILSVLSSQSIRDLHLWFVDSGASTHMSLQREFFADYERTS